MSNGDSIGSLLTMATRRLTTHSDSPRLDSELLLAAVLQQSRSHLYAWPDKPVDDAGRRHFEQLLLQRCQGQPVAYLLGYREFWSLDFKVTPAVLIPRPETELLIETALQLLPASRATVLDLGTGSGAIAVSLASERPQWQITATDLSNSALAVAADNNQRLTAGRVELLSGSWFEAIDDKATFDLIISNPPYIEADDPHLQQGDVRFEPPGALSSGSDGLEDIRLIIRAAPRHLHPGGWLILEHGYNQAEHVGEIMKQAAFHAVHHRQDLAGIDRITLGQWRENHS